MTVEFTVTPGTATTKQYKVAPHGTLTIASGQTSTVLHVLVKAQKKTLPASDTSFTVTLSSPTGAAIFRPTGTRTLLAP